MVDVPRGAERLGSTAEAVRYRALRGKWPRRRGNDRRARVQIPDEAPFVRTPSAPPVRTPSTPRSDQVITHAFESHIKTLRDENEVLREQLSAAANREGKLVAELAAEQARTSQAIAAFSDLAQRLDALAVERTRPWWRRFVG